MSRRSRARRRIRLDRSRRRCRHTSLFLPGDARGRAVLGRRAVIGSSRPRPTSPGWRSTIASPKGLERTLRRGDRRHRQRRHCRLPASRTQSKNFTTSQSRRACERPSQLDSNPTISSTQPRLMRPIRSDGRAPDARVDQAVRRTLNGSRLYGGLGTYPIGCDDQLSCCGAEAG
jgi:hypothetical protein